MKKHANLPRCTIQIRWFATGRKLLCAFVRNVDLLLLLQPRNLIQLELASMAGLIGSASPHLPTALEISRCTRELFSNIPSARSRTFAISSANTWPEKLDQRRSLVRPGVWLTIERHPTGVSSVPLQTDSFATIAIKSQDFVRITRSVSCAIAKKKTFMLSQHLIPQLLWKKLLMLSQHLIPQLRKELLSRPPNIQLPNTITNVQRVTPGMTVLILAISFA